MRILIIRHGDPDYVIDSLTEKGWREAVLLADRLEHEKIDAFYVSPLGRAQATIQPTLARRGDRAETLEWLREFAVKMTDPDIFRERVAWDWLPGTWTTEERYYDKAAWMTTEIMEQAGAPKEYAWVTEGLDELLRKHGYCRQGNTYRAERPNRDTIALVCHFGLECVLLSHLLGISPMVLWHGFCAAPTSVTTVMTEERREGIASFRVTGFGDISHLYVQGELPAFSARFCETYACQEERHD